uniref:Uncharacterized protein LOC104265834 n=1 Tax=Phallusia mammillata TaxID=59560 RepID=A0A6F9DJN0_9ASCI|nr:uncharacterized protein LOC104265834 [Phallusia mammillata]
MRQRHVPPTATLVDISTGGIVDAGGDGIRFHDVTNSSAETGLPMTFHYGKRKRRKRNYELEALKKIQRPKSSDVASSVDEKMPPFVAGSVTPTMPVDPADPEHYESNTTDNDTTNFSSSEETQIEVRSRSSSTPVSSASSYSSSNHLRAPNPTPHLDDSRFHIFPANARNAYHVYSSSHEQPAVVTLDTTREEWVRNSRGVRGVGGSKKTASHGFRILVTSNRAERRQTDKLETFVVGSSIQTQGSSIQTPAVKRNHVTFQSDRVTSSSDDVTGDKDAKLSGLSKTEKLTPKLTNVQSLVVQSCRPKSPIVVIANDLQDSLESTRFYKKENLSGHLSPLKGVRLLRRKITIRQHESVESFQFEEAKTCAGPDLTDAENTKSVEKLLKKINFGSGSSLVPSRLAAPQKENSNLFRVRNKPHVKTTQGSKLGDKIPQMTCAISVEKLALEGDPCFLLKEGNSQALNFIDSTAKHSTRTTSREHRRRQLGLVKLGHDDRVRVKIAAGGGFRSNVAHYSLLLRQKQEWNNDETLVTDAVRDVAQADDIISDVGIADVREARGLGDVTPGALLDVERSASVLPDPSTSSYRLTSDVSFDEGSRYNSLTGAAYAVDARKESSQRAKETSNDAIRFSSACAASGRLEKLADSPNRDRSNHVTPHKEAMPMSLVRIEERLNFESALGRHPPPGTFTPGSRGQSAQGANPPPAPPTNQLTSFRLHKGRQSWNYKMGDLSVNGGGYYGCSPLQPGGRIESSGIGSLSISPASNFSSKLGTRARERTGSTIKSRMSSRYGCRMDSGFNLSSTRECQYSDPCQSAPASFQQRLIELSVLESDTIKYERSRKLKRKKNLDS